MKTLKVLVVGAVAALLAPLATVTGAQAGGWAVTYLDPVPNRFEAGRGYTIGYWVLQHGSHVYDGDLGRTGLKLVDAHGKATTFPGVRLPEPAHYAAAVAVPRAGDYRVVALQGLFAEYPVGTLTVPGPLRVAPTPTPLAFDDGHPDTWGLIRPPISMAAHAADQPVAPASAGTPDAAAPPSSPQPPTWTGAATVAALAALGAALGLLLVRRPASGAVRRATRRGTPPPRARDARAE